MLVFVLIFYVVKVQHKTDLRLERGEQKYERGVI
jgi:hypothetical protein